MIPIDHPLRDIVDRHWPIPRSHDPVANERRQRAIDDLIEEIDANGRHGESCECAECC